MNKPNIISKSCKDRDKTIKPQHDCLSWFGYKESISLPYVHAPSVQLESFKQ